MSIVKDYIKSKDGNFSIMTSVVMTALIFGIGAAVDVNKLHTDRQKAQDFADSVSLAAAVFVTNNNRAPRSDGEGFVHAKQYFNGGTSYVDNTGAMQFNVNYDMNVNEEVVVEVSGKSNTLFMHVFGHDNVVYKATSTAKFRSNIILPNSVALILDNSGSMWFDDRPGTCSKGKKLCETNQYTRVSNPVKRIDALKIAANSFLAKMDDMNTKYQEVNPTGKRAVRTAMMAYNQENILAREIGFDWGVLTPGEINAMTPNGGTNSFPSMGKVYDWMVGEPALHEAENGESEPIRYVIWLTDGMNTSGTQSWTAETGTNYWRRPEETCNKHGCRTRYVYADGRLFDGSGNEQDDFEFEFELDELEDEFEEGLEALEEHAENNNIEIPDGLENILEQGLEAVLEAAESAFEGAMTGEYESLPPDNLHQWEEGRMNYSVDQETMEECQSLKADGVEIFAIGFALQAGTYYTNDWQYLRGATPTYKIKKNVKNNAVRLMLECATSKDHVMLPKNAEQLKKVFDKIGNKLAEQSIRISQ